jgi:hypothetical protein
MGVEARKKRSRERKKLFRKRKKMMRKKGRDDAKWHPSEKMRLADDIPKKLFEDANRYRYKCSSYISHWVWVCWLVKNKNRKLYVRHVRLDRIYSE